MKQLLETSESKTKLCHRLVIKMKCKQPQYVSLLNKVFIFSVILLHLAKYFCKRQYIIANMKV